MNNFDPNVHIKTVAIVGVGGTGTAVARTVGWIIYDTQRSRRHPPQIVLIDPVRVESKNIGRQWLVRRQAQSRGRRTAV